MPKDLPPMAPSVGTIPAHPGVFPPSEQPMAAIERAHSNDVLCGRGVTTNRHPGNEKFRALVGCNKELYVTSTKRQKMTISRSIVEAVRARKPPGRFLEKDVETGLWFDIGDKKAIEKTSQALRDGAASLRKQLSEDMSDQGFLDAVFDGVDVSDAVGAKGKPSFAKKSKPSVKKGHRRTNSSPAVTGRSSGGKRKQSSIEKSIEKAARDAVPSVSSADAESQKAALKRMTEELKESGGASKPLRPDCRPTTHHRHKRTASAGAAPTGALFSRETQPGSPYPRQTPPTSPGGSYMRGSPPASPYGYPCLSLPTSPFPYHCPPTPPSPHAYGYPRTQSWDQQSPAPHRRNTSDPARMNTPSPIGQNLDLSRSRSRSMQEDHPMGSPSPILNRRSPAYQQRKSYQGLPPTSPRPHQGHPLSPRPPHPPSPHQQHPPPPPPHSPYQHHYYPNASPRYGNHPPPPPVSPRSDHALGDGRPAALSIPSLGQESCDRTNSNGEVHRKQRWWGPPSPRSHNESHRHNQTRPTPPSPRSYNEPHHQNPAHTERCQTPQSPRSRSEPHHHNPAQTETRRTPPSPISHSELQHHNPAHMERPPIHTQSSWSHPPSDYPETVSSSRQYGASPRSMLRPARLRVENNQDPAGLNSHESECARELWHESEINRRMPQDTENTAPGSDVSCPGSFDTDGHPPDEIRKSFTFIDGQLMENDTTVSSSHCSRMKPMVENKVTPSPTKSPEAVQAVESFEMEVVNKTLDFGVAGFQPKPSPTKKKAETTDSTMDILAGGRSFSPLPFDHDEMHDDDPLLGLNEHVLFLSPPSNSSQAKALGI